MRKAVRLSLGALILGCLVVGYHLLWCLDHTIYQTALSPSGKFIASAYLTAEGGRPPYGIEVTIHRAVPFAKYFANPVFGGYCKDLVLTWQSEQDIVIDCPEASNVSIQDTQRGHVKIAYAN